MRNCEQCQQLLNALKLVVTLCDDGDADELTQEAARIAKDALKHHKNLEGKSLKMYDLLECIGLIAAGVIAVWFIHNY